MAVTMGCHHGLFITIQCSAFHSRARQPLGFLSVLQFLTCSLVPHVCSIKFRFLGGTDQGLLVCPSPGLSRTTYFQLLMYGALPWRGCTLPPLCPELSCTLAIVFLFARTVGTSGNPGRRAGGAICPGYSLEVCLFALWLDRPIAFSTGSMRMGHPTELDGAVLPLPGKSHCEDT